VDVLLAEQDHEWAVGRAYVSAESMAQTAGARPAEEVVLCSWPTQRLELRSHWRERFGSGITLADQVFRR